MKKNTPSMLTGIVVATAVAGLFASGCKTTQSAAGGSGGGIVKCHGVNTCKGSGACKSATHACSGHNACKGKGWIKTSRSDCETKGGKSTPYGK